MDEKGESSSSRQFFPNEVAHAPATPAKPGRPNPNMICKNWLENPFDEAIFEETSVKKSFSCWEGSFGSRSQPYDITGGMCNMFSMDEMEALNISCRDLLALADASIKNGSGYGGGRLNLCDLNSPPQMVAEPLINTGLSLQFTPLTPDQTKRASEMVIPNEDERMNLAKLAADNNISTLTDGNQDSEKGLTEQANLNETPQQKPKRRKHRPKVVTEGKPKRARKPATPKPDGSSTGKRKYVRRKGVEKSTATPAVEEASGIMQPSPDQQTMKTCKRKINFDESEKQADVVVDEPCTVTSEVVENCQKVHETESPSPITPSKTELPQGRVKRKYTQAKRKMNFLQETDDKGPSHVPSPNESNCSKIVCDKGDEAQRSQGEFSSEIGGNKLLHEQNVGISRDSLESFLSTYPDYKGISRDSLESFLLTYPDHNGISRDSLESFLSTYPDYNGISRDSLESFLSTYPDHNGISRDSLESFLSTYPDYNIGSKQCMQLSAINKKKSKAPKRPKDRCMQTCGQNSKRKKIMVHDAISLGGRTDGVYQQQLTYMESHAADFQVSIATKKKTKKYSTVSSLYHDHLGYNSSFRCESIYDIDALINRFEQLHINSHAVVPYISGYREKNALVLYQHDRSLVPYEGLFNPMKKKKQRPKVDLDDETNRVWMLLLENINSNGIDGTDEDKVKWWEEERRVFRGRVDSFIARMHLVQGDRRFSRWKGSVLDSVVGVFLTQNVSDHLSSSAFMSLAARYPLKPYTSNEPLHEEESILSVKEPYQVDESGGHGPMMLHEADSCEEKVVNSNESSKNSVISVDLNENSECEIAELSEKDSAIYKESVTSHIEADEIVSSQNSADACSMHKSEEQKDKCKATVDAYTSFVELLHMQGPTRVHEGNIIQKNSEKCASEESGISAESTSQITIQMVNTISSQESANSNCMVQQVEITNLSAETSKASENNNIVEASGETVQKVVDFHLNKNESNQIISGNDGGSKVKKEKTGKRQIKVDWDKLRSQAEVKQERERTPDTLDSMDYEAIRRADVNDVADAIKERGMNNRLAARIKDMLDRLVEDHGSIDLEWLRDVPPDKANARLTLPAPEESIASSSGQNSIGMIDLPSTSEQPKHLSEPATLGPIVEVPTTPWPIVEVPATPGPIVEVPATPGPMVDVPATPEPIVEVPASPEPEQIQQEVYDIEDFSGDTEEIPMIKLNIEAFTQNLQTYMERHMELGEGDMSKALVALTSEVASIPTPKLKNVNHLRTEHQVYELPDSHPLLEGLDIREPDDPCSYLLAIWTPGETADSIQPPEGQCCSQESGTLCNEETCFFCNSTREANSQTVRGTLLCLQTLKSSISNTSYSICFCSGDARTSTIGSGVASISKP
ncbi:hypothetical protein L1987_10164 [Smallanthus sonchifolius]|uniref:Uncharacterized protein n=1 Tax=Smallanthus sonchifolius TaxID=185202 RepID=A0ACB9JRI8_9ASTR|nr:hypothetical protein L1987_10164 [Smallanthus sonchifolius]